MTGGLLYYGHLSMRGADRICNEDLWQGTAKAAEGHLVQLLWAKARQEGLKVKVNWQDAYSSSAKGFCYSFANEQESKIILCGGHVGRAHGKKLQELQSKPSFKSGFICLHKEDFPGIKSGKCHCVGKKHVFTATRNKPACGCIGPGFIQSAKTQSLLRPGTCREGPRKVQGNNACLGRYQCRDIHEWEGGSCSFHPLTKCSCKGCKSDS